MAALGNAANAQLEAGGYDFRLEYAEFMTDADSANVGQTIFFNNRGNKQLTAHFVPGDPRRGGGTNITYTIDQTEGSVDGLTQAQTNAAIGRAMSTWDNVNCSTLPIDAVGNPGTDIGVVEFLNGLGGSPFFFADLTHAGWLPPGILAPNVIAVTFTFVWIDGLGNPTDIDNNGKQDVAFREILYNDLFTWQIDANIDVETVALHEAGHGLSQGHFGKGFVTSSNGKLHFAPRAVMNAAYTGVQQTIDQSDSAGHCSIWAQWPNN
ncbi:MAG TPA: hypothetical protein VE974_29080 [Thermoanaerobaculia bacterium]|nr:hypothetical protein [Thermoanaerobaculia bacterium]